jgi:hypothetical protein
MPDQRAEAARRQVRRGRARTAERFPPVLPQGFAAVAARWRREPGGVGRLRRAHRQIRQLGEGDQLAPGGLGPAEQDAELGVHGDLDAVIGPFGGTGSEHITARRGRDGDRVAADDGHRPQLFQGVPAKQAGRAEQLGHRRIGAAHLDRERRGPSHFRQPPRPAVLAVVTLGGLSLGAPAGNRALQAPPATGTDQQRSAPHVAAVVLPLPRPGAVPARPLLARQARERLPVGLGAQLGRQGQVGPVGPVEQPDHFWQAGHGGAIRDKSAGRGGNATPFGQELCPVPAGEPHGLW